MRRPSGRVSDSGARGRGFDTYLRRVVSLSKDTFTFRKVPVIPRKRWLRPNMTEKLFTVTLSISTSKQYNTVSHATYISTCLFLFVIQVQVNSAILSLNYPLFIFPKPSFNLMDVLLKLLDFALTKTVNWQTH